ncbi:MAG: glycosyltransferase [Thermoguttaceae bacterium]|nr:glycosyltransferase [Thermoguttaceae bacterium]
MKLTSSIALITYNGEQFFQRQLESIAQQTRLPDELIICDDCSSDRTVEIAEEFASTAPFKVRIYQNQTNLSFGLNFRKAFFLAENDVTFFCDQDDVWLPDKIEKVMDCYENNESVGMVLSRDIVVDANEKPLKLKKIVTKDFEEQPFSGSQFPDLLARRRFCWHAHNLSCRTRFRDALFTNAPPASIVFDQWLYRCMGAFSDVHIIQKPNIYFRRHGNNLTSHSKHIRNPFVLLYNVIKRHYQINRLVEQVMEFRQISDYLSNQKEIKYPQTADFYKRCEHIYQQRVNAIEHPFVRPWIIIKELFSGNYKYCSKGFAEVLMDLFAMPQKPNWDYFPTEDLLTKFKTFDQISK